VAKTGSGKGTRKLFFLHNPKAGGSALRTLLASSYDAGQISPVFFNAPMNYRLNKKSLDSFRGYTFYAGHYGYHVYQVLGDGHELVTNFRDPIARILSLYNYWRNNVAPSDLENVNNDDARCVYEAKEKAFSEFIRSPNPNVRLYIENSHFRQLYNSSWEHDVGGIGALQLVQWRIFHLHWLYITELPDLSMLLFRRAFPELKRAKLETVNKSEQSLARVTEEDSEYLAKMNKFDLAIYAYAVRQLIARVKTQFRAK
jgi:Sulfotransferase family